MSHFSQEQWIAYLYDEGDSAEMKTHMQTCAECASFAQDLAADRAFLDQSRLAADMPTPNADYGERIWDSLASQLPPYPPRPRGFFVSWKLAFGVGLAAAAVVLAAVAFYSGRLWEKKQNNDAALTDHGTGTAHGQTNVILLVVGDHLDHSQRLLAELNDAEKAANDPGLRKTAQELLAANRLYRLSAERSLDQNGTTSGADDSLKMVLDDLEPVLIELANQPAAPDSREIIRLRKGMHTSGLLFEIDMLRPQVRTPQPGGAAVHSEGKV